MTVLTCQSILISATSDDIFDYILDLENFGDWFPGIQSITKIDNKPIDSMGKTYKELVRTPFGGALKVLIKVTDIKPNKQIITEGDLTPLLPRMTITLENQLSNTLITWKMESRNKSIIFRYTFFLLAKIVLARRATLGLARLKKLLES